MDENPAENPAEQTPPPSTDGTVEMLHGENPWRLDATTGTDNVDTTVSAQTADAPVHPTIPLEPPTVAAEN